MKPMKPSIVDYLLQKREEIEDKVKPEGKISRRRQGERDNDVH